MGLKLLSASTLAARHRQSLHNSYTQDVGQSSMRSSDKTWEQDGLQKSSKEIGRNDWDKHTFKFVGDPAGNQMAQTSEQTPFMILRAAGINAQPAPSNDAVMRVEAVEGVLNRMSDGYPAMKISPSCVVLISGFEGGYQYKRTYNMGQERYDERPSKNRFSHIHDALQYAFLGGGEGRRVVFGMARSASHTTVERVGSPLTRQRKARLARGRRVAGL